MKIIITGGTGFLGRRLAIEAKKRGADVAVLSRNNDEELSAVGIKIIEGDIMSPEQLRNALDGCDIVYHLAADLDESSPNLWATNVEGTRNVAGACKAVGVKRLIFTSAIGVLGELKEPLTEDTPYAPQTKYEKSKMAAEKIVAASGVPYTIARITIIYGANRFWHKIFEAAKKGYPIIGSGNNYWHLVYVDDAIDALLRMLRPKAKNQTYNIADSDPHTYKEVYETIAKTLELPVPEKHVPIWLANFGALIYEAKCKMLGKKPSVTMMRASIVRLTRNRIVNIEKARNEIGYSPKYSVEEGMKKTLKEMQAFSEKR